MIENEIVTILFERKILKKLEEGIIYVYLPLEVVRGTELVSDGSKTFVIPSKYVKSLKGLDYGISKNDKNLEFCYIDDIVSINEQYVYGFSVLTANQSSKQIKTLMDYMSQDLDEIRTNHTIFHTYKTHDGWSKLFVTLNDLNININPENYYELQDLMYGQLDEFNTDIKKIIGDEKERITTPSVNIILPKGIVFSDKIYDKVSKTVICQDEQIKTIATAIAKNSILDEPSLKSNLLICGPTGVGKSEIFRSISSNFNIPISFEDSNEYTAASYKGKDVNEMLIHLYNNADNDLERAQKGILIIDEIDKKAGSEHETFTSAVINSLLKMMEGHTYNISVPNGGQIDFNTSFLTFAFLGAFSGIEEYSTKRRTLGFITDEEKENQDNLENIYNEETLKKYGLLPEFLGRCDTIVTMNRLLEEDFIKIINTSDKSQLLLYKDFFLKRGIRFIYDDATIEAIAKEAVKLNRGARSIKKIVEKALSVANYEVNSSRQYSELIITPETIEDNKKYILR